MNKTNISSVSDNFLGARLKKVLGRRLAESRKRLGWTQTKLAEQLGGRYDQSMISHVEGGRAEFKFSGLVKAAQALNVSLDYLAGLTDVPDPVESLTSATPSGFQVAFTSGRRDATERPGGGDSQPALGHLVFLHGWLIRHRIDPAKCSVIEILDEAMHPTLVVGALILIDHSRTRRAQGRIYVVRSGDRLLVRRLAKSGRHWYLRTDNPKFRDEAWPAEAVILGQAIWEGRIL